MLIIRLKVKNYKVASYSETTGKDIARQTLIVLYMMTLLANSEVAMAKDIGSAFRPILATLQSLAEPISYAFMIQGFLKIMAGDEIKGKKTIKDAIVGYIGVQWIPWIFDMIRNIGK